MDDGPSSSNPLFGAAVRNALSGIERLASPSDPLRIATQLRRTLPPDVARQAAALFHLRLRSRRKFPKHPPAFMTRKGLEQATSEPVADERARRIAERLPGADVLDTTSGIGADTLAVARSGLRVVAADRDPFLAACTRANLEHAGIPARAAVAVVADAGRPCARVDVVLLDPDRRADGARTLDPSRWSPTLERALAVAERVRGACIKLPPAFDPTRVSLRLPATYRWVSLRGELAEVALWTGAFADPADVPDRSLAHGHHGDAATTREAVLLDGRGGHETLRGRPEPVEPWPADALEHVAWLAEPDPAVIRAGLVGALARSLDLRPVAPHIAYLAGDEAPRSPFLRAWRVLGSERVDRRRLRALLDAHDVGPITVKKRGHPDDAETLARRLRGRGRRRGLLAIARLERGHRAFLLAENEPRDAPGGRLVGDEGLEPPTSSL